VILDADWIWRGTGLMIVGAVLLALETRQP